MPKESQKSYFPLTHYVPIFYKMIPNGHATFKLSECILVATLRLRLGGRVLGLFGSSRTAAVLVQRRWCTARRRVAMMMMMMLVVVKTAVVAVQLPIPLLPLDLLVLQRSIVATRRNGNSCRWLTATGGGMMVALMMVRRLAGAASFHGVVAARLLLIGIEAQAVFIVGMRCHLAGGTLKDSGIHSKHFGWWTTHSSTFAANSFSLSIFFLRFLARFGVYVCFAMALCDFYFYCSRLDGPEVGVVEFKYKWLWILYA